MFARSTGFLTAPLPAHSRIAHGARGMAVLCEQMVRTVVTRQELADRDPRLMHDVGLGRTQALAEARRAPWDLAPPDRRGRPAPSSASGSTLARWLAEAWRRHTTRARIADLDPHLLRDIGVTWTEAETEANKPFWLR